MPWLVGVTLVYSVLFGTGYLVVGRPMAGIVALVIALIAAVAMWRLTARLAEPSS